MTFLNNIKAWFFLSLITILITHSAFPHVHHVHDQDKHHHVESHEHTHHSKDHSHHQNNTEEEGNGFDNALEQLAHGVHDANYKKSQSTSFQIQPFVDFDLLSNIFELYFQLKNIDFSDEHLKRYWFYQNILSEHPVLSSPLLRAPPIVG
ncbi:MAG: hypothetical protein ACPG6V_07695 [Flavobacteriales bacterium]